MIHTYLRKSGAVVSLSDMATDPVQTVTSDETSTDHFSWGDTDDDPVIWREKMEASSTAMPLIADMVGLMFGKGLNYYVEKRTATGVEKDYSEIVEVEDFFDVIDVNYFVLERMMDFKTLCNCFCQFIKNKSGNKIRRLVHLESEFSRFEALEPKMKISKHLLYKSDWSNSNEPTKIPYLPRIRRNIDGMNSPEFRKHFAIHSCFPSPGNTTYAKPIHFGILRKNSWLDYANSVPELMNLINTNAMSIKYHIQIPYEFWESKYPGFKNMTPEKRTELQTKELDAMDEWLVGVKNVQKSFITHYGKDPISSKPMDGWKIDVIDDKTKREAFVTSLQEADTQISRSIGMDVSMSGIQGKGTSIGAGSGSDKRVGFTNTLAMSHAAMSIILEPLYLVAKYNGWPKGLKFEFIHEIPVPLNEDKSGTTEAV